jgi:hypothetical protein
MPDSDTPHLHQTVTNPSQAGWNQLSVGRRSSGARSTTRHHLTDRVLRVDCFVASFRRTAPGAVYNRSTSLRSRRDRVWLGKIDSKPARTRFSAESKTLDGSPELAFSAAEMPVAPVTESIL